MPIPSGHCGLILFRSPKEPLSSFYLSVPIEIVYKLCRKPRKYLLYLGWCILGVEGSLALESTGENLDDDGDVDGSEIYRYVTDPKDRMYPVDIEVIKSRTHIPSETTRTREDFRDRLLERDICCVWTAAKARIGDASHIIPHRRGSEWLRLILNNRPQYDENVDNFEDINDIRNGVFVFTAIHRELDSRNMVILKTPNCYLRTDDIPRHTRAKIHRDTQYPRGSRYTLQTICAPANDNPRDNDSDDAPDEILQSIAPDNVDATFKKGTRKPKPSSLLLHYNYGAAAVRRWGTGADVLWKEFSPPRPSTPIPAAAGPSKSVHDRDIAIGKRDAARAGLSTAGATGQGALAEQEEAGWDADDVILFFWGNTRAARDRHAKQVRETAQRMEQWREGVSV